MTTGTAGNITIDPNLTGNLTLGSADNATTSLNGDALNIDAAGALQINSSAGVISIGNNANTNINISTGGGDVNISKTGEMIDYGVEYGIIDKSGSWFSYNGTKLGQGRESVKKLLSDNIELSNELEQKIKANFVN